MSEPIKYQQPVPRLLAGPGGALIPHPYLNGVFLIDPDSLRGPNGEDPYLVLADGRTVRQVRADHAADLLLPEGNAPVKFRLATAAEVEAFRREDAARAAANRALEVARAKARAEEAYRRELAVLGETPESVK